MKLIAHIERKTDSWSGMKSLKCTFPIGRSPFMYEAVLTRNLGPRPYAEGSYVNTDGRQVVVYMK